ncbi:MAG: glycosyltransferase family 39 protein [Crocinitomicaceae bacterium]|jgi:hypothetical protein|nr:glycosyltransferase family 39 protein [Crocinitomicaceae bacterium]
MTSIFDWKNYKTLLFLGLIIRLVAAIFSEGYGMHDDHFLIVEASTSWVDGYDYNNWLPWSEGNQGHPEGHSFTYVGLNYLLFYLLKLIGLVDPYWMMLVNRIVHALFSMLIPIYGIRIAEKLMNQTIAKQVGWVLALLWIVPFISVRNLVEVTAIPFLMMGTWFLIRERGKWDFLLAGLIMGMSVSFRYQVGVFLIGIALYYLIRWEWKKMIHFCIGVLLTFVLTQGLVDFLIWGYPFAEFWGYVTYNMKEGTQYMANSNYFMYFYVCFGVLLFPLGILALPAYFASAKKYFFLFLPTFLFLIFHTLYPNRQERFIATILPFVILLAIAVMNVWQENGKWAKVYRFSWRAFWVLNIPLLLFFSITSSKVSRVESMYALYGNDLENEAILVEASGDASISMLPKFYGKAWYARFYERTTQEQLPNLNESARFDYIFFVGKERIEERIQEYDTIYPNKELVRKCIPSLMDRALHSLNPRNSNEYIEVWKTNVR